MKNKIKVPVGIDSFRKLVTTSDVFVDKSLFIQEVLEVDSEAIKKALNRAESSRQNTQHTQTSWASYISGGNSLRGHSGCCI